MDGVRKEQEIDRMCEEFYLPEEFRLGMHYYQRLRGDSDWVRENAGNYLAFMGEKIIDADLDYSRLSQRVRQVYGNGPIFMPFVTEEFPNVERLSSFDFLDGVKTF